MSSARLVKVGEAVVLLPAGSAHVSYLAPLARHLAADIAGVLEALAAAPAHVVGHAFGNRVARCLATDRPDPVRRVVLLAGGDWSPRTRRRARQSTASGTRP
jgi:pimeloyl-ACP methyl ester carboxylesterase